MLSRALSSEKPHNYCIADLCYMKSGRALSRALNRVFSRALNENSEEG